MKRKLKFKNYKNCLEATQLDNKIKNLEKKKKLTEIVKYEIHKKQLINIKNTANI